MTAPERTKRVHLQRGILVQKLAREVTHFDHKRTEQFPSPTSHKGIPQKMGHLHWTTTKKKKHIIDSRLYYEGI